ncbi:MAG: ROK family protein [Burkholderiales bacterium]|nr:ROK family protein [Burkholderiales bacterium]
MRLGIDLGGTKTEIVAIEGDGTVRARRRVPTPQGDYAATVRLIAALVDGVERELGARAPVGIGIPGSISPVSGRVRNANSVCLNGQPLRDDLQALLGRELRIENDANCFAMAEAHDGAAAGAASVRGANGIAGEWGHNPLPPGAAPDWPGEACYCGRRGCIETWLCGPALARQAGRPDADAAAVSAAAAAGDPLAIGAIAAYADRLARALAGVINLLDPAVIVLGGGVSNIDSLYEAVPRRWRPHVFADSVSTRLLRNRLGDSAGVFGAARLWPG